MVKLAQRLIEALHPFVANVTQVGNVATVRNFRLVETYHRVET